MLVGYVSDERYVAVHDVAVLIENEEHQVATRSRADGSIKADIPAGRYHVTLAKDGFGSKRADVEFAQDRPHHFRLLSDCLLGYAWPKWVRCGEKSEFRVHSAEAYKLSLWRYGIEKEHVQPIGWFDEHDPLRNVAQGGFRGHSR